MSRSLDTDTARLDVLACERSPGAPCDPSLAGAPTFAPSPPGPPTPPTAPSAPTAPTGVRVRPASDADHAAVLALLRDLELGYVAQHLASFLVAEGSIDGGAPEVFGIAEVKDLGGFRLLSCVGVREDLQGLGLGRVLVERALDGVDGDVWLYTLIPGFFTRLGFEFGDAPPAGLPPRRLYGCDACHPERCHRMVRRGPHRGRSSQTQEPHFRPAALAADAGFEQTDESVGTGPESLVAEFVSMSEFVRTDPTCDLTPAALWIWRDCETPSLHRVGGNLCVRMDPHHEAPYFLEPLGDGDLVASLETCLRETGRVTRVRSELARRLPADRFEVTPLRDHFDYVCDVRDIAALRGSKHDGKRNQIRKFAREHPRHVVRALTAADRDAALALFDRWGLDRGEAAAAPAPAPSVGVPARACQRRAIARAFEDFDRLRLAGAAVVEDGAFLGFLVASRVADTAFAHFLYADAAAPGVYQTLLVEACRTVLTGATCVNLEEDLGIPGLRRTKLSWQPARLLEKFAVALRPA